MRICFRHETINYEVKCDNHTRGVKVEKHVFLIVLTDDASCLHTFGHLHNIIGISH